MSRQSLRARAAPSAQHLVKKVFPRQERKKTGVRGIPSPFINLDERGRDTPHPSLCPLLPRKDLFAGLPALLSLHDAMHEVAYRVDDRCARAGFAPYRAHVARRRRIGE